MLLYGCINVRLENESVCRLYDPSQCYCDIRTKKGEITGNQGNVAVTGGFQLIDNILLNVHTTVGCETILFANDLKLYLRS